MNLPSSPIVLVAVVTTFFIGLTLLGLAIGYSLERFWGRRIWSLPTPPGQVALELRGNVRQTTHFQGRRPM